MRLPTALAAVLSLCAAGPDRPLLRPNRDVDITYRATAANQVEERVRWLAASQIMRIDPPASGVYVIIDYVARRMSVVRDATKSVVEMAAPDSMGEVMGSGGPAGYMRRGEATVAGLACTEWQTVDRESRTTLVCITGDGVLLRAGTPDQPLVSAVSVTYAPQDPAAFRVPADYAHHAARAPQ